VNIKLTLGWKPKEEGDAWQEAMKRAVDRALVAVAAKYLEIQEDRIESGVDLDGVPFEPYSKRYFEQKARAGQLHWLRVTGEMLRSQEAHVNHYGSTTMLTVTFGGVHPAVQFQVRARKFKNKKTGTIYDLTAKKLEEGLKTNAQVAGEVNAVRPFVGVNQEEADELEQTFRRVLREEMAGIRLIRRAGS